MVMIMTGTELPKVANNTAANAIPGKAIKISIKRMIISLPHFSDVAAVAPKILPKRMAQATAPKPINNDVWAPYTIREKISRPSRSVPNQYSALGARIRAITSNGSCVATQGANTATKATKTKNNNEIFDAVESARNLAPLAANRSAKP